MKALVQYLVRNNIDDIVYFSRKDCHAVGLDSIVLGKVNGRLIRIFATRANHTLWMNRNDYPMSVGYHAHHCDITLVGHTGLVQNRLVYLRPSGIPISIFHYASKLTHVNPGFRYIGVAKLSTPTCIDLSPEPFYMNAEDKHTIYVPKDERASWFVFEGEEDPNYIPLTYSNVNLEQENLSHLYQSMTKEEILETLTELNLY